MFFFFEIFACFHHLKILRVWLEINENPKWKPFSCIENKTNSLVMNIPAFLSYILLEFYPLDAMNFDPCQFYFHEPVNFFFSLLQDYGGRLCLIRRLILFGYSDKSIWYASCNFRCSWVNVKLFLLKSFGSICTGTLNLRL